MLVKIDSFNVGIGAPVSPDTMTQNNFMINDRSSPEDDNDGWRCVAMIQGTHGVYSLENLSGRTALLMTCIVEIVPRPI